MADHPKRPRGWHLDPSDPTTVRHWDGEQWQQVRSRPTWSVWAGDLVVDMEGRFETGHPWSGPTPEGPARTATQRAAAGAMGLGAEGRRADSSAVGGSDDPTSGGRATGPHASGPAPRAVAPGPWTTSRGPMALVMLFVTTALAALAATVVWPTGPRRATAAMPSAFVSQASQACALVLGSPRPSALPDNAAALAAEADQLDALRARLQVLSVATGAQAQADVWLASWQRFSASEIQRAQEPPVAATNSPDPSPLARRSRAEAQRADNFAADNGLQTCTILAYGPAPVASIPT